MWLGMWSNLYVLADNKIKFAVEVKWETIWGAQSRVPRASAQSRSGAWGSTPMQPLFDGTTQLATYVEKGWSCLCFAMIKITSAIMCGVYATKTKEQKSFLASNLWYQLKSGKIICKMCIGIPWSFSPPLTKTCKASVFLFPIIFFFYRRGHSSNTSWELHPNCCMDGQTDWM